MSLRGRRLLLSPGGALQWWLGIMALSALPATTLVPGRPALALSHQTTHAQRLTFLIPLRGGRSGVPQPGDSRKREKSMDEGKRKKLTAVAGKTRPIPKKGKDLRPERPEETGQAGEHTPGKDSGVSSGAADRVGGVGKARRRGGKRGRAQRVHRRLFRDGEGGPAGPTVLGAAVLAAANGTTGKGAAVIHKFHALSKSLEREKRAGNTTAASAIKKQLKLSGGIDAYQDACSQLVSAPTTFNTTAWVVAELSYRGFLNRSREGFEKVRLLDVGTFDNRYAHLGSSIDALCLDTNPRDTSVLKADFLSWGNRTCPDIQATGNASLSSHVSTTPLLPPTSDGASHTKTTGGGKRKGKAAKAGGGGGVEFDCVVLSMVLNCEAAPERRCC